MRVWRGWPRWLKGTSVVLVLIVMVFSYLFMVNVVLRPRVILDIRSEVPGIEVWYYGARNLDDVKLLGKAPLEIEISEQCHPISTIWNPSSWKAPWNSHGWMGGMATTYHHYTFGIWETYGFCLRVEEPKDNNLAIRYPEPNGVYWTPTRRIPLLFRNSGLR